ncbi:hypothetical protein C3496_24420 [Bacillus anthracis]|nr:hypothetical protein C3496_24420 [Bacillus anthracis]THG59105.1 hypothetical protein E7Y01_16390 [Bacillus sp. HUB-I-004]
MIFYKKINDSGNVWAFNMTYFFIIFILKRKGIICIFIQIYKILLYLLFNPVLKIQKSIYIRCFSNQLNNPFPNRT